MGVFAPSKTACPDCNGPTEVNEAGDWIVCRACVAAWSATWLAMRPYERPGSRPE